MKRTLIIFGLVLSLAAVAAAGLLYSYYPIYYVTGKVNDGGGVKAEGHMVCFYKDAVGLDAGLYAYDQVGTTGLSTDPNQFSVNILQRPCFKLTLGEKYKVAVVQDLSGYGAGPVEVTYTGRGAEIVSEMTMALNAGIPPPPPACTGPEPPKFKEIWFNNRLYHKKAVEEDGRTFYTSPAPEIKLVIEGGSDFGINSSSIRILRDDGSPEAKSYSPVADNFSDIKTASSGIVSAMTVTFAVPDEDKMDEGEHVFAFKVSDTSGSQTATETSNVSVLGGTTRVIGPVVVYPSPYSPTKDRTCDISYTLSTDTDIEVYIYSIAGELVKRLYGYSGQEGGSAGLNKVAWDGKTTFGQYAGNGIYSCTIHDKLQNRMLASFKLTIVH